MYPLPIGYPTVGRASAGEGGVNFDGRVDFDGDTAWPALSTVLGVQKALWAQSTQAATRPRAMRAVLLSISQANQFRPRFRQAAGTVPEPQ